MICLIFINIRFGFGGKKITSVELIEDEMKMKLEKKKMFLNRFYFYRNHSWACDLIIAENAPNELHLQQTDDRKLSRELLD